MRAKKIMFLIALAALVLPMKLALADPAPKQNSAQLKQLSAEFAALQFSLPVGVNPWLDSSGADCMVGQSGRPSHALARFPKACRCSSSLSIFSLTIPLACAGRDRSH